MVPSTADKWNVPTHCTGRPGPERETIRGIEQSVAGSGRGGGRGNEFVTRNLCRDPHAAAFGCFDANNFSLASNMDVARLRHLLGKGDDEFNFASDLEVRLRKEVQAAIAEISRACRELMPLRFTGQHSHRKIHIKSPRYTAFRSITHQ